MTVPPNYRQRDVKGRPLWWEDMAYGTTIRLYYPDHNNRLRLVFINDGVGKQYFILDRKTFRDQFGITYKDLGIHNENPLRDYVVVDNLDPHCNWPVRLYPDGPPNVAAAAEKAPLEKLTSDITDQATISRADAWI